MNQPAPRCPRCSSVMHRIYERPIDPVTHKQLFCSIGWRCSNPNCRFISQD